MGVPAGHGLYEAGFGFKQLGAQPKATTGGSGTLFGDLLVYDNTTSKWIAAVAASTGRFGFNANTRILSQTTNNLTGVTTSTRGSADADVSLSVLVSGRVTRVANGAIAPGRPVMPTATGTADKVKQWDGTDIDTIIGIYVLNKTQFHDMDASVPSAADLDVIVCDVQEKTATIV